MSTLGAISTAKLYRCGFWMKHFKSKSPKRTRLWSCSWAVALFGRFGKLSGKSKKSQIRTTRVYFDKKGRRRYTASAALKGTQILVLIYLLCFEIPMCFWFYGLLPLEPVTSISRKKPGQPACCEDIHATVRRRGAPISQVLSKDAREVASSGWDCT